MYHQILAQAGGYAENLLFIYILVAICCSVVFIFIFRAVLSIPAFLRYQKAQIKLLEQMAKSQGVDDKTVQSIISESIEWDSMKR